MNTSCGSSPVILAHVLNTNRTREDGWLLINDATTNNSILVSFCWLIYPEKFNFEAVITKSNLLLLCVLTNVRRCTLFCINQINVAPGLCVAWLSYSCLYNSYNMAHQSLEAKTGCGVMIHYIHLDKKATFDFQGALFTKELINHNISVRWTPS